MNDEIDPSGSGEMGCTTPWRIEDATEVVSLRVMMDLDQLVQAYADRLELAVILFDTGFAVASFSKHDYGDVDLTRTSTILSRTGSTGTRERVRRSGASSRDIAVRIPLDSERHRWVVSVRHQEQVVGYLSSIAPGGSDDDEPPDEDELLRDLRAQIGVLLAARALVSRTAEDQQQRLVAALLDGDEDERTQAADALLTRRMIICAPRYTAVSIVARAAFKASPEAQSILLHRALAAASMALRSNVVGAVIGDEAVLIVPCLISTTQRFAKVLADSMFSDLHVGISGAHAPLSGAFLARREARTAAHGARVTNTRLVHWEKLGLDRVLLQLPLDSLNFPDLPEPVQRLLSSRLGAGLAQTLEAYLDCGCNAQRTAEAIRVHRSTLYYRLERIRIITGADLSSGVVRLNLHAGLRVAALAGLR